MKKDVVIITGPTAVGKTSLAIKLAQKLNTEIISCDSMQIYKHMDIGTAKITKDEMKGIKHHLIDIVEPYENFSVQDFQSRAYKIIDELHSKNKVPIVVGGTGLYIDSLTHNFNFVSVKPNKELRSKLEEIYSNNPKQLLKMVLDINKEHYKHLGINDKKKLIRAYEVYNSSNTLIDYSRSDNNTKYNFHVYVLNDDRKILYNRINSRVDIMINKGLIDEVKNLLNIGVKKDSQSMKAIGYKEVIMYINNLYTQEIMVEKIKQNSRRYAKRQLTWFRRNEYSNWINISEISNSEIINSILSNLGEKKC